MITAATYSIAASDGRFQKTTIERRELGPHDVLIAIRYAGICHSDIHTARNEWNATTYPCVPGHEIAGIVAAVGPAVVEHKVGDRVGVGCVVDSCGTCPSCVAGEESYCASPPTMTYNYKVPEELQPGGHTLDGYSTRVVVTENFVLSIPEGIGLDEAAPLLCAGITLYSPLRHWHTGPGKRVAIVGMGGTLVMLGLPDRPLPVRTYFLAGLRRSLTGSMIGSILQTQEMPNFCAEHGIGAEIEVISADRIGHAYDRIVASDVRYRFVIDTATI